ncbi:hypothetical protein JQ557_13825 [Bradyrhizobium sp. U87765 SZCCT0131]|uniref:hypothetical protein n=1 Tax=unclassified Bradyrhizobium TaxID=2631580 RepID=UPI001BA4A170|nr:MULTISPECIES: hypothetical protein [unclassified Bradyrhizobium]MBR1219078.1 hypothetical protein [Bradyrhizobium sp. U87765 SZCCT0131]MBR1261729.1 hypothetical protein [Bradyrhizobium sp. U87765 SZCCT0134]MBR1306418.1 hypothetical protein [Bradyrhizobium sp. U87765 SZCCT0110]MBR1317511.1 hypothetical protein [Bradyrhizobium sp. U87765 SZCCT0109]MBR1351213.1 hypothetical protein [Bradyrhizobium sp. U87765 SZCCT0048]
MSLAGKARAAITGACLAATLAGCGYVDPGVTFVPERFRQPSPTASLDPEPDVKKLVADNLQLVFAAHPTNVRVGPPHREGMHWQACVTALVPGAGGAPLEVRLLVSIEQGKVGDRTRVTAEHWCAADALEPI